MRMMIISTTETTERRNIFIPVVKSTEYFYKILIHKFISYYISYFAIAILKSWDRIKKSTSLPLQAWSGPEGSRNIRFPDFMTTAQDGGKVVSLMHRPLLPPGNAPGTHFC